MLVLRMSVRKKDVTDWKKIAMGGTIEQDDVLRWIKFITTWRPHKKKQSRGRWNKAQVGWNENVIPQYQQRMTNLNNLTLWMPDAYTH